MTDLDVLDRAVKQEVAGEAVLRPLRLGILLDPADDLARLAYADALEELGRTVEASRIRARLASPGACEEAEACGVRTVESRGFVRSASCTLETFLREAGRLFPYYPITEVALADKSPWWAVGSPPCWACYPGDHYATAHSPPYLPEELFRRLDPRAFNGLNHCTYGSDEAATRDLSRACVNYGRSLAGLPPLEVRARV